MKRVAIIIFLALCGFYCFAQGQYIMVITTKEGRTYEGKLIADTKDYYRIQSDNGSRIIYKEDIDFSKTEFRGLLPKQSEESNEQLDEKSAKLDESQERPESIFDGDYLRSDIFSQLSNDKWYEYRISYSYFEKIIYLYKSNQGVCFGFSPDYNDFWLEIDEKLGSLAFHEGARVTSVGFQFPKNNVYYIKAYLDNGGLRCSSKGRGKHYISMVLSLLQKEGGAKAQLFLSQPLAPVQYRQKTITIDLPKIEGTTKLDLSQLN